MTWLGLDIGGANLKAATATGWAYSVPFALWRDPGELSAALAAMLAHAPAAEGLAVTMTGELCDCFTTKVEGVRHILAAVCKVAERRDVRVYLADGRFASVDQALEIPSLAAASNWRALAEYVCQYVTDGVGLLIDAGSTTTDIIPIEAGHVAARSRNDTERLAMRELYYGGVGRTPVCAVTRLLPWHDQLCPVAAELFSTTADAYLLLAEIDEDEAATWTADGRPLTLECSRQRLARQLCADAADLSGDELQRMASFIREAQTSELKKTIVASTAGLSGPPQIIVVSGAGEFLAVAAIEGMWPSCQLTRLSDQLGAPTSHCAPAYAIAWLASAAE